MPQTHDKESLLNSVSACTSQELDFLSHILYQNLLKMSLKLKNKTWSLKLLEENMGKSSTTLTFSKRNTRGTEKHTKRDPPRAMEKSLSSLKKKVQSGCWGLASDTVGYWYPSFKNQPGQTTVQTYNQDAQPRPITHLLLYSSVHLVYWVSIPFSGEVHLGYTVLELLLIVLCKAAL